MNQLINSIVCACAVVQYRGGSQMFRPRSVRTAMPTAPQGAEGVVAVESIRSLVLALIKCVPASVAFLLHVC